MIDDIKSKHTILEMNHDVIWQKSIQHCKAIILQLKINLKIKIINFKKKSELLLYAEKCMTQHVLLWL